MRRVEVKNIQADEIWAYVGMKEKTKVNAGITDPQKRDAYTFVGFERPTKVALALAWLGAPDLRGNPQVHAQARLRHIGPLAADADPLAADAPDGSCSASRLLTVDAVHRAAGPGLHEFGGGAGAAGSHQEGRHRLRLSVDRRKASDFAVAEDGRDVFLFGAAKGPDLVYFRPVTGKLPEASSM